MLNPMEPLTGDDCLTALQLVAPGQARERQAGPEPSIIPRPVTGRWLQALHHLPTQCCMCRTALLHCYPPPAGHLSHHQTSCLHLTWACAPGHPRPTTLTPLPPQGPPPQHLLLQQPSAQPRPLCPSRQPHAPIGCHSFNCPPIGCQAAQGPPSHHTPVPEGPRPEGSHGPWWVRGPTSPARPPGRAQPPSLPSRPPLWHPSCRSPQTPPPLREQHFGPSSPGAAGGRGSRQAPLASRAPLTSLAAFLPSPPPPHLPRASPGAWQLPPSQGARKLLPCLLR